MQFKISSLKKDKVFLQRLYMISIAAVLILVALAIRDMRTPERFISDDKGRVTEIINSGNSNAEYELELTMMNGDQTTKRNITIRCRGNNNKSGFSNGVADEEMTEAMRDAELSGKITDIELSNKSRLALPSKLSDGTSLVWSIPKKDNGDAFAIAFMYVILLLLIVKSALESNDDNLADKRKSILCCLPRFTNQLLLMMNVGIILSDAFSNICDNYEMIKSDDRNFFEKQMIEINRNNADHRDSTAKLLTDFASKYNAKEMMRIATILMENERRGSDVLESLERESEFLWENRKITATERGKALDAKMAYPLGLLLIILIIITIAPAFLSM